ncbi:MAG: sensor histidine kinase [Verrucomicrobia bacterium]|nr:sensor histidine kinase [Verrucomicrobiota bacterium]
MPLVTHEIEITEIPPLQPKEQSLLAMHSLLNVFNVLRGELVLIGINLAQDDTLLHESLAVCDELIGSLQDPAAALATARQVDAQAAVIFADIEAALAPRADRRAHPDIVESLENLRSVFSILRVRAREQLARAQRPDRWREFLIADLRCDFLEVFSAFEKNSHGRFRITYNAALQEPRDYYFDFKIESSLGDRIVMPVVFQDVLRDLVANARKYTAPGGHITAALYEDAASLRLVVEDTGRGIPSDELATVVHYGRRASNVGNVRTMGGGFGLTKAFFVTKQFGGRFWIASTLGVGTRIRLQVPRPAGLN